MTVRLTWVERDRRGTELARRDAVLHGESEKNATRKYVGKLIDRHHPELMSVDTVHLNDSYEEGFRWYVKSYEAAPNRWVTVYADPIDDVVVPHEPS